MQASLPAARIALLVAKSLNRYRSQYGVVHWICSMLGCREGVSLNVGFITVEEAISSDRTL